MSDSFVKKVQKQIAGEWRDHLVIIFVPSHDRHNKELSEGLQAEWAQSALELISAAFGGGTAFQTFKGIYRSETGEDLLDKPILVESYVTGRTSSPEGDEGPLDNPDVLRTLADFLRRMRRAMNQECVLVVINDCRHFLK